MLIRVCDFCHKPIPDYHFVTVRIDGSTVTSQADELASGIDICEECGKKMAEDLENNDQP